jgi:type II secretory pathway pseudopilin PulG
VVIAIIAVLASLLLPALSTAKEAARTSQCITNIQQYYLAYDHYLDDHDRRFSFVTFPAYLKTLGYMPNRTGGGEDSGTYWQNRSAYEPHVCPSQTLSFPAGQNRRWHPDESPRRQPAGKGATTGPTATWSSRPGRMTRRSTMPPSTFPSTTARARR